MDDGDDCCQTLIVSSICQMKNLPKKNKLIKKDYLSVVLWRISDKMRTFVESHCLTTE